MSNYAIQVKNLGKMYRIGGKQQSYDTFREIISRAALSPFRKIRDLARGQSYAAAGLHEEIWALKDVTFDVKHGEVVGIIGRNGAGKSTLLKILSRITDPSAGYADIYGRVGALLEVGTGFHPELTGRENVYLNGAILGMSRRDIDQKFDEIVDFAGVEKFIDTPVKHYSSGMGLRLGFAVAAHLEPEILVVDEVLAVGDAEFQKKCLGKMSDVALEGRTVLFVSHNLGAVSAICERSILLEYGQIIFDDISDNTIQEYLTTGSKNTADLRDMPRHEGTGDVRFTSIRLTNSDNTDIDIAASGHPLILELGYECVSSNLDFSDIIFRAFFSSIFGERLFLCSTEFSSDNLIYQDTGTIYCQIPRLPLAPGKYNIDLVCKNKKSLNKHLDKLLNVYSLQVVAGDFYGTGKLPAHQQGSFLVDHSWYNNFPEIEK
jgi:lipopolysaccharide transport system ATP-binding protein